MPVIEVFAQEGRFQRAYEKVMGAYEGPLPTEGKVEIALFEENGTPWLVHPMWAKDNPDDPGMLYAHAKDLFREEYKTRRGDILDRAADLRSRGYWAVDHVEDGRTDFRGYAEWSKEQRRRLYRAEVRFG